MTDPHTLVEEFHAAFKAPIGTRPKSLGIDQPFRLMLRLALIHEELRELEEAADINDLIGEVDALGDLVYVIYGMAIEMGVDLGPVLQEIHQSNMSKLDANGDPILRHDGKILKGPNFEEPDLYKVLQEQGY